MAELKKAELKKLDYSAFLRMHGKKGTVIKYNERKKVEITEDTATYVKGQVINPHKLWGQYLIDQKVARAVRKKD